jgi:hypothetical protein
MVYDFLYAFFYQLNNKLRSDDPKYYARMFVILSVTFHLGLILVTIKKFIIGEFNFESPPKYTLIPFVFLFIWILDVLLKKREEIFINKYQHNLLHWKNTILVLSVMFAPLIITIIISKK